MSLINQMLRDLEERRKTENPQLAVRLTPATVVTGNAGLRWLWLILLGITLGGLTWYSLNMFSDRSAGENVASLRPAETEMVARGAEPARQPDLPLPPPISTLSTTATTDGRFTPHVEVSRERPAPRAAASAAAEQSVPPPAALVKQPPSAPNSTAESTAPLAPATGINLTFKGGVKDVSLLDFGVVEGVDSVRLMFEFAKLPDYRVSSGPQNASEVRLLFFATDKGDRLEIPAFRGPLLQSLDLTVAKQDLQLRVAVAKPIKVQAYSLPADAAHGERLLVEFSIDRGFQAPPPRAAITAEAGQEQPVLSGDLSEQAEILSRKAVRYLDQGNAGAAKIQFAKALELTPGNVELRQQLVDLLLKDQQLEKAESLLLAGLTLAPLDPALRTRYGRLLFDRNQLPEALELLLKKPLPDLSEQPDYHALLATLEQESGLFVNAATRYRELLQVRPAQAEWWLLLAITYEQLNDVKLASSAYRQALEKSGLTTEHRQFSLERLERLQRLEN